MEESNNASYVTRRPSEPWLATRFKEDWIDEPYPEDMTELLLNHDINVDEVVEYDEYEYDTSSDEEL